MKNLTDEKGSAQGNKRSNFELLRIVAMFMIVIYHIVYHSVIVQLTDASSISRLQNGWFSHPIFYKRLFLLNVMNSWGQIGNGIFILISGYFMLPKGKEVNVVKTAKKMLFQLGFASVILVIGSALTFYYAGETNYFSLANITVFNSMSWYIGYYFIVILIGRFVLNERLMKMEKPAFTTFLVIMFAIIQFSWLVSVLDAIGSGLSIVATGVFLYSLGGYIRRYDPFGRVRLCTLFLVVVLTYALIFLSSYNTTQTRIEDYYRNASTSAFSQNITGYANNSIVVIIVAVVIFELFKRIRLPRIRWINFLGASTFMIYLLHDNSFFYSVWSLNDWITDLHNSPLRFLIKLFGWGAATFLAGVAAYGLYLLIMQFFKIVKPVFVKPIKKER